MYASLYHVQINVADVRALAFYTRLFDHLGYRVIDDGPDYFGVTDDTMMFVFRLRADTPHACQSGLRHLAFRVGTREAVDLFYRDFLQRIESVGVYSEPREYAEFTRGYYAVRFEDPNGLSLEVAYIPV